MQSTHEKVEGGVPAARPLVQILDSRLGRALKLDTPDLFDEASAPGHAERLREDWVDAYESWAAAMAEDGTLRSRRSFEACQDLWATLAAWAVTRSPAILVDDLTAADLRLFVLSRDGRSTATHRVSNRHAWRVLTLVDRVLVHRAKAQGHADHANRCADDVLKGDEKWRWAQTSQHEPKLEHLSAEHARQLVEYLIESLPRSGRRSALRTWRELRDAAAVALHLGGGITPGEARELQVDDLIDGPVANRVSRVVVKPHGQTPRREVPLAQWASRVVAQWRQVRAEHKIDGPWLLPSTGRGTQWKKAGHNLAVGRVLALAKLPLAQQDGGCFRLRHTFALRQLERGTSLEALGALLGLKDEATLERYRAAMTIRTEVC